MPTSVEPNTASPLNNRIHNEDSLNRKRTELLQELKVFFASVYEIRKKLSDPFSDETEEVRNEVEKLLEELDVSELSRLEEDLIFGAESVQLEEINDSRYHFSDICHRYTAKFDAFRKSRTVSAGKDLPRCELVLPEYVEHGDIHVLPTNSSVILREKELSSFM